MNPLYLTDDDGSIKSIFGLTLPQLKPILEKIVSDDTIVSFHISLEHQILPEFYGGRGEKVIPTFTYTTQSRRQGKITVFVKQHCNHGPNEALHYKHLEQHHAPIPRMYHAITGRDRQDIVFIEYINPVLEKEPYTQFINDDRLFHQFLDITAQFNAIQPSEEYAVCLETGYWNKQFSECEFTLAEIWDHAGKGRLGKPLRKLCTGDKLNQLRKISRWAAERVSRMEEGLYHWDHRPCNVGFRQGTGEMLIFDLEDTMFAPRFLDVAVWLGTPDDVQPRCRPRRELALYYLERYNQLAEKRVQLDEFLDEVYILWIASTLKSLSWNLNVALNGPVERHIKDSQEYRHGICAELHELLGTLLLQETSPDLLRLRSME